MKEELQELWDKQDDWKETVVAKLRGLLDTAQTRNLDRCGREKMFRHCKECGRTDEYGYHCDLKFCPRCNHRIAARRMKVIRKWSETICQPKHVVTTQRNFPVLTRTQIRKHQKALVALRRSVVFEQVRGGCVSVEITNESRGWHLHAHWLVDARWIDAADLAKTWASIIGQDDLAIVKVKDVRGEEFVAEVAKYVVKGSQIATWEANEVLEFVTAIRGCRFFFSFGTLFKMGREIRMKLKGEREHQMCECGCTKFTWRDETTEVCHDIMQRARKRR